MMSGVRRNGDQRVWSWPTSRFQLYDVFFSHSPLVAKPKECQDVKCDAIPPSCPIDSLPGWNFVLEGGNKCCPKQPTCHCNLDSCHDPTCNADHEPRLLRRATGRPGECCDVYECQYTGKLEDGEAMLSTSQLLSYQHESLCFESFLILLSYIIGPDCSSVKCPPASPECPADSYALPNILPSDGCCSKPQG